MATEAMGKTTQSISTDEPFDPKSFLVVPARTFEKLSIGDIFRAPSRTLTDAHSAAFQTVSADNHPVHYDAEWARKHGHPAPVLKEVHSGDTLYPTLRIVGLEPEDTTGTVVTATVHNQRGELVLTGEHKYLLRLTPSKKLA